MEIEKTILLFLNSFTGVTFELDFLFYFLAQIFPIVLLLPFLYFFVRERKKYTAFLGELFFAGLLARYGFVEVARHFFPRLRPCHILEEVNLLLFCKESFSYPSGHTAFIFAVATVIYYYNKSLGKAFFVFSFFIGVSRVVAGAHWPSDIFGGALLGVAAGIIVREIVRFVRERKAGKR